MDDHTTTPSDAIPPATRTAEALRELHERTRAALSAQRARMGELESQLTNQLNSIAAAVAEQTGSSESTPLADHGALEEIARLHAELESTRAAWNAEREAWQAEQAKLTAAAGDHAQSLDQRQTEIESRQQALDGRAAELNHLDRELRQRQELLDSYAAQSADQQSQLTELENKLAREREELVTSQSELRASQSLIEHQQQELAARAQACERDEAALKAERAAFEAEREVFATQRAESNSVAQSAADDLSAKLATNKQEYAAEREVWERDMSALRAERRQLAEERDELQAALDASHAELKTSRVHAGAADERDELRQKFELALEDVQRLRSRVTELEQELASRPAADQTDSVELVHLRAERDALAQRVTELERQTAAPVDVDASQEMADLQRRFELAVEDVRDLKKQNSQLEADLAEARSRSSASPAPAAAEGGSSWELMKRKMLADLEEEIEDGEAIDEVREKERATIENTIHITDEVVANKDREIAELKTQLAEGGGKTLPQDNEDEKVREIVDADEVVRQHRERIAQLEHEMEEKLRAAELELSVERAKIAREQAQLADLRAELDSQRNQGKYGGSDAAPGQPPKRRWLSKLGLSGEED